MFETQLLGQLKVHTLGFGDSAGGIEDLEGEKIPGVVIIQNDTWASFVALGDRDALLEDNGQNVGSAIVAHFHGSFLQYTRTRYTRSLSSTRD